MDVQLLKEFRDVSEKIGKLYSDLETLEARRAQLEQQIHNNGTMQLARVANVHNEVTSLANGHSNGFVRRTTDKQALPKMREFLKRHWISNKVCTSDMIVKEFGCTSKAAVTRLRAMAKEGMGRPILGPYRLEKI